MIELIKTAPKRIYLCVGDDDEVLNENFHDLGEVCWAEDLATNHGIEYVRADIRADVLALCDRIEKNIGTWSLIDEAKRIKAKLQGDE